MFEWVKGKEGVLRQKIAMSFIHSIENKEVGIQITIAPYRTKEDENRYSQNTEIHTVVPNSLQVIKRQIWQFDECMKITGQLSDDCLTLEWRLSDDCIKNLNYSELFTSS